jgi:hypothetical protein
LSAGVDAITQIFASAEGAEVPRAPRVCHRSGS